MSIVKRRIFLKILGCFSVGITVFQSFEAFAKNIVYKVAELAETKKNPSIKALKYVANATNSKARTAEKNNTPAAKQLCDNCDFYKEPGVLADKKDAVGKYLMLSNQLVHAKGWCNTWTKKIKKK